jgi:hypothetical protein
MSTKPTTLANWASDANYSSGPDSGTPTKVAYSTGAKAQGFIPASEPSAQGLNEHLGVIGQWVQWLYDGALTAVSLVLTGNLTVDGTSTLLGDVEVGDGSNGSSLSVQPGGSVMWPGGQTASDGTGSVDITGSGGCLVLSGANGRVQHPNYSRIFGFDIGDVIDGSVSHVAGQGGSIVAANSTAYFKLPPMNGFEQLESLGLVVSDGATNTATYTLMSYNTVSSGAYVAVAGATGTTAGNLITLTPTTPARTDAFGNAVVYVLKVVTTSAHTALVLRGSLNYSGK